MSHYPRVTLEEQILLTERIEWDATPDVLYKGFAPAGARESDNVWVIQKFLYDSTPNLVKKLFADGSRSFNKNWTDRGTYEYV